MAEGTAAPPLDYPFQVPPEAGATLEVAPGIHWLRMPLPWPPDHINLWLLRDGDGWTIVDAGLGLDETKAHWERIFAERLDGRPVRRLIVTHFHPDHLGLGAWLGRRWQVEAWMTAGEWYTARGVHGATGDGETATKIAFYRRNGVGAELLAGMAAGPNFYRRHVPEVPASFRRISGGAPVAIDGRDWLPIIGRGHCPEHACLWAPALNLIIGGDILLPRITPNISVWPNEPLQNPLADYLDCLDGFAHLPGDTLVLPSHGLPYRGLHQRIGELKGHHAERLDRLAGKLDRPHSAAECFAYLFRREIGANNVGLATGEAVAHLHLLEAQGRVVRAAGEDGIIRFART